MRGVHVPRKGARLWLVFPQRRRSRSGAGEDVAKRQKGVKRASARP
ncbi:MAG: hypothetical protein IT548_07220 [Alphaproteobacteria bacterium]|nr:hypothetical protein [Alphaproteobacteria bacterium]